MSDRAEFEEARRHGLEARHETRVERAREREAETLATEVEPWLQQCGSCDAGLPMACTCPKGDYRVILLKLWQAYKASRVLVAEEIAEALEAIPAAVYPEDIFLPGGTSVDAQSARVMRFAYPAAARIARDVGAQEHSNQATEETK